MSLCRAKHQTMKRIVAVKVLNERATQDDYIARRFQREVQAAAQLIHPNIVYHKYILHHYIII